MPSKIFYDKMLSCVVECDFKRFSLRDPKSKSYAVVDVCRRKCQKIHVDGCMTDIQPTRCDWCIRDKSNGECMFVELKGSDCKHAVEQIVNTVKWFRENITPFILHRPVYIVARSRIPSNGSQEQIARVSLAKKVGATPRFVHPSSSMKVSLKFTKTA